MATNQAELFEAVISALGGIGYAEGLIESNYAFADNFVQDNPTVVVPAVAFGQFPSGYDSACFAVVRSNGKSGPELIRDYRALGAPRAFEVYPDRVIHWRVSLNPTGADAQETIWPETLATHFRQNRSNWEPSKVLRAKDVAAPGPRQLDFVDVGLIPALEESVRSKLGPLLETVLFEASKIYQELHREEPEHDELVRLVFRALTGKVMSDRGIPGFDFGSDIPEATAFLLQIAKHYQDSRPILHDATVQQAVVKRLWQSFSFRNLSVEVLAFIWEDTLVTDRLRALHGIHATPAAVARYMTHRLPLRETRPSNRFVVEPCCGSGVFLVAALHRLRELLSPLMDARKRHRYFKKMLKGFDIDEFGLEVARSCLMLADFPNPNGWQLRLNDVFMQNANGFITALKEARVVLCNPPFEDFTKDERKEDAEAEEKDKKFAPQKPIRLLNTVLDHLHPAGSLGFVLPAAFLDGRSYRDIRRRLAKRFQRLEVVRLPDKVFEKAEHPCALLMASHPTSEPNEPHDVAISFASVIDADMFLKTGDVGYVAHQVTTIADVQRGIGAPKLAELWEYLEDFSKVKQITKPLSRGVEWTDFTLNKDKYISDKPKRGCVPGFHTAHKLYSFQPPPFVFLWNRKEARRGGAWDLPWHNPKVIVNAVRKARQPWRLAACPVELNAVASQNFTVAWPIPPWTANTLSAVLNGPVAAAYVATHENWKHNKKKTLAAIPLPDLSDDDMKSLDARVQEYRQAASLEKEFGEQMGLFGGLALRPIMKQLLQTIDTIVLRGYRLTPALQKQLFSYFGTHSRPVPFDSDITAIERGIRQTPSQVAKEADELRSNWELFRRAMEEDRFAQRSLFRWRE